MSEPDELYTLRAQFWLGHYQMALDEAKSIMRRPMSSDLKAEREEIVARCYIAMKDYDKVISGDTSSAGLKALALQAQFAKLSAIGGLTQTVIQQLQSMLGDGVSPRVQLTAAHVFLQAGMKKEALQCVHQGLTMEQISLCVQIYIILDRLDLAQQMLQQLRKNDEDSMLTQLTSVQVALATGSSMAGEAVHTLNQISEQYGPSPLLLNLMACAQMQGGNYAEAERKLSQAREEFSADDANTLVNLIVASQHQHKPVGEYIATLKKQYPTHFLSLGLDTVGGAFDREAIKYRA
jgi:coatomer protein complex subunit epsilon